MKLILVLLSATLLFSVLGSPGTSSPLKSSDTAKPAPNERHLANIKQLTFGGENAEAYFSADGKQLILQSTRDKSECDQIYTMNVDGSNLQQLTNSGRTTCAYFLPSGKRVLYSSTHLGAKECPVKPDFSKGYVWAVYPVVRHFHCQGRWFGHQAVNENPGLRCGDHYLTRGQVGVYFHARW